VIVLAVRWYLRFGLSYRDIGELLAERGVEVDHVTVYQDAPTDQMQQRRLLHKGLMVAPWFGRSVRNVAETEAATLA
jgi:hypothetical protein